MPTFYAKICATRRNKPIRNNEKQLFLTNYDNAGDMVFRKAFTENKWNKLNSQWQGIIKKRKKKEEWS